MGLRAFKYQRVSDDRAQGRSVEEQERENNRVIDRRGWECVGSFTDNDRGASRYSSKTRPQWDDMLTRLARGEADVLVTWEASRSTRDLSVYVALRDVCRKHGVLWSYNGTEFDLSDGDDSFRTGLDILLAEKEVEQTRKRVMRATQANAERGLPHGKLLFGYKRNYADNGAFIEQVEEPTQAAIVREAFDRALHGERDQWIVNDFIAQGLTTGRGAQWSLSQMKRMLMNPGYAGLRVHRGQVIGKAVWPGIITEEQHYQILARYKPRETGRRMEGAVKHLLSGIARCGVCGGVIQVNKPRGYPSYYCRPKFCVARKIGALDELITGLVIARLSRPDVLALLAVDNTTALEAIDKLAGLKARLAGFYDAAARGEVTPQALASIEAALLPQIEQLEARARQVSVPGALHDVVADPAAIWPTLHVVQKREIIAALLTVYIDRSRRGERKLDPATIRVQWKHEAPEG